MVAYSDVTAVKVEVAPQHAMDGTEGSRGIDLLRCWMGMGDQRHASAAVPSDKKADAHCTGGCVPSLPVWKCVGKMKFLITAEVCTPRKGIASPYTDYLIPGPAVSRGCFITFHN